MDCDSTLINSQKSQELSQGKDLSEKRFIKQQKESISLEPQILQKSQSESIPKDENKNEKQQRSVEPNSIFIEAHSQDDLESKEQKQLLLPQESNVINNSREGNFSTDSETTFKLSDSKCLKSLEESNNQISQVSVNQEQIKSKIFRQQKSKDAVSTVFVRVKSEEVKINNNKFQPIIQEKVQQKIKIDENEYSESKRKLAVINNLNLSINPLKEQEIVKPTEQIDKKSEAKKQDIKFQPLDIKTLSGFNLSSQRSIDAIKPPSPKGQRKLKPWEIKKKSKITDSSELSTASVQLSTISPKINFEKQEKTQIKSNQNIEKPKNLDSNSSQITASEYCQTNESVFIPQKNQINSTIMTSKAVEVKEQELKKQFPYLKSVTSANPPLDFKFENKKKVQIQPQNIQSDNLGTQLLQTHHNNSSHPLLRFHSDPFDESKKDEKNEIVEVETPKMKPQEIKKNQFELQVRQIDLQPSSEKIEEIPERPLSEKLSISSNSVFQDDKLALQLQKKKRLEELEIEIKKRRSIRDQLERSTPLGVKFLLSIVVGSVVGSTSYLLKRRKLSSIVSGVAAGVSTFLFIK